MTSGVVPGGPAPDVVCLDVGEVLIDETRIWATWARMLGISPLTFAAVLGAELAGGNGEAHVAVLDRFDPSWRGRVAEKERRLGGLQPEDLYPDALPSLDRLREAGIAVAVAGNQPAQRSAELRALGVDVEVVVTSEELGVAKPDAGFYAAVLELLGDRDPSRVLYVGDRSDNDVGPAARFGLRTAWLRRGPWGVLLETAGHEADVVVSSLEDLVDVVLRWHGSTGREAGDGHG